MIIKWQSVSLPAVRQAAENAPAAATIEVPVRFYIVLSDGGFLPNGATPGIDQTYINTVLTDLSTKYSTNPDYTFNFQLCGDINFIRNTSFQTGIMNVRDYTHVEQAANVYVTQAPGPSQADLPWGVGINNGLSIKNYNLLYPTLSHEFGHHFGLWHTFEPERFYNVPDPSTDPSFQEDHPYNTEGSGHPRELVIREVDPSQNFPDPNHAGPPVDGPNDPKGGDLVKDTPAGCRTYGNPNQTSSNYPGCSFNDTNCTYTGTYVDYNGMPIDDPDNILAKNIMSYNTGWCRQEFVDGQLKRAAGYYFDIREHQYWAFYPETSCGNLDDRVEFEDTDHGLDRVAIEFDQGGGKIMKTLTNPEGDFDGIGQTHQSIVRKQNETLREIKTKISCETQSKIFFPR